MTTSHTMTSTTIKKQIAHARAVADETYSAYKAADDAWFMMLAVEEADDAAARAVRLVAAARAAIRARDAAAYAYEAAKHAAESALKAASAARADVVTEQMCAAATNTPA